MSGVISLGGGSNMTTGRPKCGMSWKKNADKSVWKKSQRLTMTFKEKQIEAKRM